MTKKHFRLLASHLHNTKPKFKFKCPSCDHHFTPTDTIGACPCGSTEIQNHPDWREFLHRLDQWERSVDAVAAVCKQSNSNFDRSRFNTACENGL